MENPCEKCTSHWSAGRNTGCLDSCKKYKVWKECNQARRSLTSTELRQIMCRIKHDVDIFDVFDALEEVALYCFAHNLSGLDVEVIRYQLKYLYEQGKLDIKDNV